MRCQGFDGIERIEVELLFCCADIAPGIFESSGEQRFLVAEIVVEHLLVGPGAAGNDIDPRPHEPVAGEFCFRGGQNPPARSSRIAPFHRLNDSLIHADRKLLK